MSDVAQIIAEIEAQMAAKPDVYAIVSEVDLRAMLDEMKRLRERLETKSRMYSRCVERSDKDVDRIESLEAELARLRRVEDDLRNRCIEVTEQRDVWEKKAGEQAEELARLREPAGEVGEMIIALNDLAEYVFQQPPVDYEETVAQALNDAAELLTRQAAEIERLTKELGRTAEEKHALSLQLHNQSGVMARATTAEAKLREAVEVIGLAESYSNVMGILTVQAINAFLSTLESTNDQ